MQIRKADLGTPDLEARTVPVVLATDYPVQRHDFIEVLDVSKVDLSRGDLPLIESHDHTRLNIGVVRNVRAEGGKLRGVAQFGTSARASEVLADVQAGIVTGVSIGYEITDAGEPFALADGRQARRFGFMPYEVSAVAIPADPDAGFNKRSHPFIPSQGKPIMTTTSTTPARDDATINQVREMLAIGEQFARFGGQQLARQAIDKGESIDVLRAKVMTAMSSPNGNPIPVPGAGAHTEYRDHADMGEVRMLRTAEDFRRHYAARAGDGEGVGLADFLRGVARMKTTAAATRALSVGVDTSGGFAVPSAVMPQILEALAPASTLLTAGAGIVPLTDGAKTYSFAAVEELPTASWREENGDVAESGPTFRRVLMTPRSLSFVVKVSRELLADGMNIGGALEQAIAQAFAKEIDRAGLRGSGTAPEVRGLRNTAGVHTEDYSDVAPALVGHYILFDGLQHILDADGPMPTACIMSPRTRLRFAGLKDSTGQPLRTPEMLDPVKMLHTSQIPNDLTVGAVTDCSEIYMGDFTRFAIGMRENVSVQVMNEAYADKGQIGFMCHARLDVALLYPKAFAILTGIL